MPKLTYKFYDFLSGDDELRSCESIPDSDCTNVPRNFILNITNGSLTKLAERIISPNLTLPWILSFLGAPAYLIGMLVPVKDAGSLLPQLFVSGRIRSKPIRKYYWSGAALVQAIAMAVSAVLVYFFDEHWVSWALVGLLALFSIASGVASVSFKDVTGKTIPKGERGRMLSYRATFGGLLALAAGIILIFVLQDDTDRLVYTGMFLLTAMLWLAASVIFFLIKEEKGSVQGGRTPVREFKKGAEIIGKDTNFRNFLITRALLMAVPLLQPFYVIISKDLNSGSWNAIAFLIIISGLAQVVSSPFWGRFADENATKLMRVSALMALFGAMYALAFVVFDDSFQSFYAFLPVFFINGVAYAGARLSRKTYLVDYAPDDDRPTYVSVANTFIGIFTIVAAGFGFIAEWFGLSGQLLFFAALLIAVVILSFRLKKL